MFRSNEVLQPNTEQHEYLFIDTSQYDNIGNNVYFENETKMKFRTKFNETIHVSTGKVADSLTPGVVFKNIKSIELCGVSFNKHFLENAAFNQLDYIIIDIQELNGRIYSNSQHVNGVFALLYLEDGKAYHKGRDFFDKIKTFKPPLSSLSSFNVCILTPENEIVSVPENASMTMMFKITSII